mgnify:CR=1 FL=1
MNKVLIIVGPTGSGKTKLGLKIAKDFDGEIVSCDSRQVYKGLNIGTGKDIPKGLSPENTKQGVKYVINGISVWGYDLVGPKENFNVSGYVNKVIPIINEIGSRGKLPIVVGGTGLYVKGLVDGIETSNISVNEKLRENLENREVGELFDHLAKIDPLKAASMNSSDKQNPRRLIRAIEIAQFLLDNPQKTEVQKIRGATPLFIGLTTDRDEIGKRIERRVEERIAAGQEHEINDLIRSGLDWQDQSLSSIGYRQWKSYLEGKGSLNQVKNDWISEEKKYAKRQMTWFKKDRRIMWFDVKEAEYPENVEKIVYKWYHDADAKKG